MTWIWAYRNMHQLVLSNLQHGSMLIGSVLVNLRVWMIEANKRHRYVNIYVHVKFLLTNVLSNHIKNKGIIEAYHHLVIYFFTCKWKISGSTLITLAFYICVELDTSICFGHCVSQPNLSFPWSRKSPSLRIEYRCKKKTKKKWLYLLTAGLNIQLQ